MYVSLATMDGGGRDLRLGDLRIVDVSYHSALKFSHLRPVSGAHLYHSLCTADEVVPSLTASIHYVLISSETAIS